MKSSKKLFTMVALLLVAVIASISTTFAWITLNNTASVESFNIEVGGTEGLLVGVRRYVDENDRTIERKDEIDVAAYNALDTGLQSLYSLDRYELISDPQVSITAAEWTVLPTTATDGDANDQTDYNAIYALNVVDVVSVTEYNNLDASIQALYSALEYIDSSSVVDAGAATPEQLLEFKPHMYANSVDTSANPIDYIAYERLSDADKLAYTVLSYASIITATEYNALENNTAYSICSYSFNLAPEYATHSAFRTSAAAQYSALYNLDTKLDVDYYNVLTLEQLAKSTYFVDANVVYDTTAENLVYASTDAVPLELRGQQMQLTHATYYNNAIMTITDANAANAVYDADKLVEAQANLNYISFELFFRSTSVATNQYVRLYDDRATTEKESAVTAIGNAARKVYAWRDFADGEFGQAGLVRRGTELNVRAANAVRIGFDNGTDMNIWDPNKTTSNFFTNKDDGNTTTAIRNLSEEYTKEVFDRDNINVGTVPDAGVEVAQANGTIPVGSGTVDGTGAFNTAGDVVGTGLVQLTSNLGTGDGTATWMEGSMVVNIWLEGTDAECFNAILRDAFATKLSFVCFAV